jgi:hypothetical protein
MAVGMGRLVGVEAGFIAEAAQGVEFCGVCFADRVGWEISTAGALPVLSFFFSAVSAIFAVISFVFF